MASRALDAPQPICSPEHKGDAASGTMVLGAIIGADGKVANLNVISGAEWMRGCVLDAVSQWTYKPYLLNGVPTEVETTINIQIGAPATPPQGEPIHVSGGIMAGTILTKGQPPICAPVHKGDHVSGATVLHAIISPDGRVASLKVISGPEAVRACALDSVRQWTYRPYLINGVPVAVETTITLNIGVQPTDDSPPAGSAPVRVSGGVLAGTIINKVQPIYPPEARTQHINGAVVVSVIIGTTGM